MNWGKKISLKLPHIRTHHDIIHLNMWYLRFSHWIFRVETFFFSCIRPNYSRQTEAKKFNLNVNINWKVLARPISVFYYICSGSVVGGGLCLQSKKISNTYIVTRDTSDMKVSAPLKFLFLGVTRPNQKFFFKN